MINNWYWLQFLRFTFCKVGLHPLKRAWTLRSMPAPMTWKLCCIACHKVTTNPSGQPFEMDNS